jgi:hypothetical protein
MCGIRASRDGTTWHCLAVLGTSRVFVALGAMYVCGQKRASQFSALVDAYFSFLSSTFKAAELA